MVLLITSAQYLRDVKKIGSSEFFTSRWLLVMLECHKQPPQNFKVCWQSYINVIPNHCVCVTIALFVIGVFIALASYSSQHHMT